MREHMIQIFYLCIAAVLCGQALGESRLLAAFRMLMGIELAMILIPSLLRLYEMLSGG